MPGNKTVFQEAMKRGHNAAWDQSWSVAVAEYRRATGEMPEDPAAHLSLGHALEECGQLEDALHECRIASKLMPHDPQPIARIAVLQEKLGKLAEAAGTYLGLAEIYTAQQATGKAVEVWQRAAALEPDRIDAHVRLAEVYEKGAHRTLAAKEYVVIARIYKRRGDRTRALNASRTALSLEPENAAALELADILAEREASPAQRSSGPVSRAQQEALSRLAETLLEDRPGLTRMIVGNSGLKGGDASDNQARADALIARAVDAQSQHRVSEAVDCYRALLSAGVTRLEVKFNLGLLYLEKMLYDDAIALLSETVVNPDYMLASHFALGQCYRAKGKIDAALEHFIQVTKIVDLSSVDRQHADELITVYEKLAEGYIAKGDRTQAEAFSRSLEQFLTSKGWEDKVTQVHQHLETLRDEGNQVSLAEVIELPGGAEVLESLALSQEYLRRGKFEAAGAECFRAIEIAPYYLPAHVRLAEIMEKSGRTQDAREKLQLLAEVAAIRQELPHAERYYRQLVDMMPNDVGNRSKLVDVLVRLGRITEALKGYVSLGDEYGRQANYDRAAEQYDQGLKLAAQTGTVGPVTLELRQRLAEARMHQGDLDGALTLFKDVLQLKPTDERARVVVAELEFRTGQISAGTQDLSDLLATFREQGEWRKTISLLEGLVHTCPKQAVLWAWLAKSYIAIGEKVKAVSALDTLGELQLSAGKNQPAAATIRQIIALGPPNVEEYRKLLEQIGS